VREVSQAVLNVIMYEKDLQKAKNIVIEHAKNLVEGKIDIQNLTVSKSLKRVSYEHVDGEVVMEHGYKMASQPHLTVAKKLETRMPGTGPKSGERVPYVFIETENPKDQQFKKAEDPEYAKAKSLKLDIKYYLEHALMSPLESLFELFLENPKEELFGQFIPPKKKRARKKIQIVI
jgi:DNA polymerase delta subunit 1